MSAPLFVSSLIVSDAKLAFLPFTASIEITASIDINNVLFLKRSRPRQKKTAETADFFSGSTADRLVAILNVLDAAKLLATVTQEQDTDSSFF